MPIKFVRGVDVGSACVDIQPSPKTDVLVYTLVRPNAVMMGTADKGGGAYPACLQGHVSRCRSGGVDYSC